MLNLDSIKRNVYLDFYGPTCLHVRDGDSDENPDAGGTHNKNKKIKKEGILSNCGEVDKKIEGSHLSCCGGDKKVSWVVCSVVREGK